MGSEERLNGGSYAAARDTRSIVWIASYPKSGNTWIRLFLSNLLADADRAVPINGLTVRLHAASRDLFDEVTAIDSGMLSEEESAKLRPSVYRHLACTLERPVCIKIHDACSRTADAYPLIPEDVTAAVLYVVRNPLDVVVSYAHHDQLSLDRVIERLADETFLMGGRGRIHLLQHVGSWSSHIASWLCAGLPIHVARFEDLRLHPVEEFSRLAAAAGIPAAAARIGRAIGFSSFDEARRQEAIAGFGETPSGAGRFFRSGTAGGWRAALSPAQVDRIVRDHGPMMTRFGYLTPEGSPA